MTWEIALMIIIAAPVVIAVLLLLAISDTRAGGTSPRGKVSDTPPRPTYPPGRKGDEE